MVLLRWYILAGVTTVFAEKQASGLLWCRCQTPEGQQQVVFPWKTTATREGSACVLTLSIFLAEPVCLRLWEA